MLEDKNNMPAGGEPEEKEESLDKMWNELTHTEKKKKEADENEPTVDATAVCSASSDRMIGYVTLTKETGGGKPVTKELITAAIDTAKIVFGVDEMAVNKLAEEPKYDTIEIAFGRAVVHGENGVCKDLFARERALKPVEKDNGTVDFWDLDIVQNVVKGDVICEITHETNGADGSNIFGDPIVAKKGKAAVVPVGKGVALNGDKTKLLATEPGNLVFNGGKFNVEQVYTVNGDVDLSTGNVNFIGDVIVAGDVREGFEVKAKGNITVRGMIEGASIIAGGDVIVSSGMNGANKGEIICQGNLQCKFVENSILKVRGNITSEYIAQSKVLCDGEIDLIGNRGLLLGGNIVALKKITAKTIGSPSNIPTAITLGAHGTMLEEKDALDDNLRKNEKETEKIKQIIEFLSEKKQQLGKLPEDKETLLSNAVRTKTAMILERSKLTKKLEDITKKLENRGQHSLSCKNTIFRGTRINIANSTFIADRDYAYCTIYYDEVQNEIVVAPMRS